MRSGWFFYSDGRNLRIVLWTLLIGAFLIMAAGAWGLAHVAAWIVPSLGGLAVLALGVFVVGVLPLSLGPASRPQAALLAGWIATGYRVGVWMISFWVLWTWLGLWATPFIFLPFLAAPLAVLRSCLLPDWNQAAGILLAWGIAGGLQRYAVWLAGQIPGAAKGPAGRTHTTAEVIETTIVETHPQIEKQNDSDAAPSPTDV